MRYVYREKYKGAFLKDWALPVLRHTNGATVLKAEVLEAGTLADKTEFQVIRVILRPADDAIDGEAKG